MSLTGRYGWLAVVFGCFCASAWAAPEAWTVSKATVRVRVSVDTEPDHPDLGVYVKIPDGGLLPGPVPVPTVVDGAGKSLQSIIVGYHKPDGLGVLFEPPADGKATIYLTGTMKATPPEGCTLKPSLLMFARNGKASLDDAERMAKSYPPAPGAFFDRWSCIGSMVNPFGPDDNYVSWFVGCIVLEERESIYFATISDEGSSFMIDGKPVMEWGGTHTRDKGAKGQMGKTVSLEKGVHRIDYFHFELKGKQEAQLVWRRKGMETKDNLPELVSGFAVSGGASIRAIELKDGRVCGFLSGLNTPSGYLWTGEKPLNLFTVSYGGIADGKAKAVIDFGKGQRATASTVDWLVEGDADQMAVPVTLEVSNAAGVAKTTARLTCPWTPTQLSLDESGDRLRFRTALYNMLRAVPEPGDPCAPWTNDQWQMLGELLEPYRSGPILKELFTRGWATVQKRPDRERWMLEDRWIETLRLTRYDALLLEWIDTFEKAERNVARKFRWKDERICAYLYDLDKPALAQKEVTSLKDAAATPDQTQIAFLRQGDYARATGDTAAAVGFYKEAQERYRARNKIGMAGGRLTYVGPRKARKDDAAETNAVAKAGQKGTRKPASLKPSTLNRKVDDWKVYTVHDASFYATITSFLAQDALAEALQKLADWENESPASKLSGEYPMAAARIYLYVKDFRRAVNELDIYCRSVEMSAQLADAMKLETEALAELSNRKRMKEIAQQFLKRFPGHPYEQYMKELAAE